MNAAADKHQAGDVLASGPSNPQPEQPAAAPASTGAASPMVQFKAMLDLRMSLFWGNILLVVPLVLYPVIYLIIFFASGASAYPPAPHVIPDPWAFRWFMPRVPSYVGGGSTTDPAMSNAMLAAVNASVQAMRVANEGKDSVAMIPSLWHRANTLDELKGLLASLTGSNPVRNEFRPDATPPIGGFMLHSIPTAQQPSDQFNVSLVVDPTPYTWAWGVPVAMLNSVHNGVQDVLPLIRNRNVSADANLVISDSKRAALDRVFALYQNATAAGRKVIPPWSMGLEGEQHAYRLTGTERAEYISSITVPLLLFSIYSLLMSVAYDLTAERVEGQFSYLVTNSLAPYIYFFSAMAGYLQIIVCVMAVLVLWYTRLHWISPFATIVMMLLFCGIVVTEAGVFSFAFKSKNSVPGVLFLFTVLGSVGPTLLRASEYAPSSTVDWILSCIFPSYAMTVTFGEMMTAARNVQTFHPFQSTFPATAGIMLVHIAGSLALVAYLAHRASLDMLGVNSQSSSFFSRLFTRSAPSSPAAGKKAGDVEAGSGVDTPVSARIPRDPLLAVEKERIRSGSGRDNDVIRIEGLGMDFAVRGGGHRQVIQDLWFTVRQNEAFAFLGPNGAGKSTTVNILTGMLNQTKGTATICGKPPGHPDVQRLLGVLPQYDTLFSRLSVHKHLRAFALIKGVPLDKVDDVIKQAAADATLDKFMYRKVEQLSGGTKRRMSIAIACLGQPAVVILDEPTIGVDVCTRRAIWEMVARLKKSTSILLVTHDMDEAERLCERAGIMINGSLVCLGAPQRLKALFGATYLLKLQFANPSHIAPALADLESNIAGMGGNARVSQQSETHLELCIEMSAMPLSSTASSSATAVTEGVQSRAQLEVAVQAHAPFLASMLRFVSGKRADFGITDWSLGEVSLGELFVQLAPHHRMYQEEEAVV